MKDKNKATLKKLLSSRVTRCFVVFAFFALVYCMLEPFPVGDDTWFASQGAMGFSQFAAFRYYNWSSRNIIEAALLFFATHSSIIARVFTAAVLTLLAAVLFRMFTSKTDKGAIFVCAIIPVFAAFDAHAVDRYFSLLTQTGFMATTLNYLYPLAFGVVALYPLKKLSDGEKICWYDWIICPLCLVFAANQEQMCCVLLASYILFGINFLIEKKLHLIVILQTALSLASLVFILTCPGNSSRLLQETLTWNARFSFFDFSKKLDIGVSGALDYFLQTNLLLILLSILLAVLIFKKYNDVFSRTVALVPLCVSLAFGPFSSLLDELFGGLTTSFAKAGIEYGWLGLTGEPALAPPFKFFVGCVAVVAVAVCLYLAFGHRKKTLVMLLIFGMGLATRAMLGFSPTAVISGTRTAFFLMAALLVLCVSLFDEIELECGDRTAGRLLCGTLALGCLAYITMLIPTLGV